MFRGQSSSTLSCLPNWETYKQISRNCYWPLYIAVDCVVFCSGTEPFGRDFTGRLVMRKVSVFFLFVLLAACTVPPASPSTPPALQSASITQTPLTTVFPPATFMPFTTTPAATGTLPVPLPRLEVGSSLEFDSIHMIDPQSGWGIEKGGHIVRTADGGDTWEDVTPPHGSFDNNGFFALDADTAWSTPRPLNECDASQMSWDEYLQCLPGPQIVIWRTTDGGKTWQSSEPYQAEDGHYKPVAVQFVDARTGWFLYVSSFGPMGSTAMGMAKTEDGGSSWKSASAPTGMCIYRTAIFLDTQDGWSGDDCRSTPTVGIPLEDFLAGRSIPYLSRTTDGARSWEDITLPSPQIYPDELISPNADQNISILCGTTGMQRLSSDAFTWQWTCSSERGTPYFEDFRYAYLTADNGGSWNSWLGTGNEFFLDARTGWRLYSTGEGNASQLQQTTDGGRDWKTIKTVTWQTAQFDFVSEQMGWAIVNNEGVAALIHTRDGGRTWVDTHPMIDVDTVLPLHTAWFLGNLQRTGVNDTSLPETIRGKLKWKTELGYAAFSSPAVVDGIIYYAADRSGFFALDSETGQVKWSYPASYLFFGAAPAVADGVVYFSEQGVDPENLDITCLHAVETVNGQEKWHMCTAGWATSDSPAVSDGTVYFGTPAGVLALDAEMGQEKWRVGPGVLGSIALAEGILYYNASDGNLYAVDPTTRQAIWKFGLGPTYHYVTTTPAVSNGMVYLGGPNYLHAVDAKTGQERWKFEAGRDALSVVANGESIYFISTTSQQMVYALDAFTGQIKWKSQPAKKYAGPFPILSDGVLYLGCDNKVCALDAVTGQVNWVYSDYQMVTTSHGKFSAPVIDRGTVYFSFGNTLYAIK